MEKNFAASQTLVKEVMKEAWSPEDPNDYPRLHGQGIQTPPQLTKSIPHQNIPEPLEVFHFQFWAEANPQAHGSPSKLGAGALIQSRQDFVIHLDRGVGPETALGEAQARVFASRGLNLAWY